MGVRSRRGINGAGPCSSGLRRTRSSRSRPSSTAVPCPAPGRVAAEPRMPVEAFAPAKVNLYLHVIGQRADGYHLLDSLVAFADIGDRLTAAPAGILSLEVSGPEARSLPSTDADHLELRAASLLAAHAGIATGAGPRLQEDVPVAPGIVRGTGDAAPALRAPVGRWREQRHPVG